MSETKVFSLAEIAKHNSNKSTWIAIHNNIYDVTEFLNEHPGGEEVLLDQAGKNGTEAFEDVGHSSEARELMQKYKIGEVIESERIVVQEKSQPDWSEATTDEKSSFTSWLVPLALCIFATIIYRYLFS